MTTEYVNEKEMSKTDDNIELGDQYRENQVRVVESNVEDTNYDAVFGEMNEDGPKYRNVGWIGTVALMMKSMIGLGVLSIPSVLDTLGMIPGIICLLVIAAMTSWSNYVVGTFKLNHRDCYGIDDAGRILFGKIGREFFAVAYVLYQTFCAGSGMLSISISFNALSEHGACTAVFVAVAAIIAFSVSSIRTLGKISFLAWIGLVSILVAIFTLTVSVGVQDRPAAAPITAEPFESDFKLFNKPTFVNAISAISSLVFSYAGTPSFFPIIAEMKDPRRYTRSLIVCQTGVTITYLTIGIVVYYFCGSFVSSPALGSAGPLLKKVCYGIALPGLIMSTTLLTHLPAKYLFLRFLRGSKHLTSNSAVHWGTWIGCVAGCALFSYIISSAIPIFGGLVSLIGALLGTLMSMQPMACMWFYDSWAKGKANPTNKFRLLVGWNISIIVVGTFLMIAGTYGSIVGIADSFKAGDHTGVWSCADNSGTVKST
ncbi:uncharacterized protein L201_000514 [Kwoniella dendrophila CBS 6074]|uniref:Amino acid transporter transmembrane domain-containing protein n=1 Tax=Kwoniella dendrophila CBS 6074 TaxID=1295534 RepID=A0AAX4JMM7_9TREE